MAENPTGGTGGPADVAKEKAGVADDKTSSTVAGDSAEQADVEHETERSKQSNSQSADKGALDPGASSGATPATASIGADSQTSAPALGASGTSMAAPESGAGDMVGGGGEGLSGTKLAGAAAAVPAAGAIGQIMLLAMFINWLKGMAMALAALASNLGSLLMGLVLAGAKALAGVVMGIGGAVAGAVGGAVSAVVAGTTTLVSTVLVAALVAVGVVGGVNSANEIARKDGLIDCKLITTAALSKIEGSDQNVDETTLKNAQTIYGVLSAWGMPNENIAGIIGNWDAESGIDPTSVQNYFEAPQQMTDIKQEASANTDNGIGLGQWTFGRNQNLRDYAGGHGKDWWTLDVQLGFMISAAESSDAEIVKDMMVTSYRTPTEAAMHFHDNWERSGDTSEMAARRGEKANKWMGMSSGWDQNKELADSILAQAGTTVGGANESRAETVRSECRQAGSATLTMAEGGLNLEEATELMETFKAEGEAFLQTRYGALGPGDCGFGKADNCVGFSTYFVNRYTSFQQYAAGNGIDTAGSMAGMMGKDLIRTPKPYSVASGPGLGVEGHTMVVLGIQGDNAVIGEANCGTNHVGTKARLMPLSELTNGPWEFVDVSDLMTEEPADA